MYHLQDSQAASRCGPRGPSTSARLNSVDSFAFHVSHTQLGATTSRAFPNTSHAACGCQTTTNRTRFHAYMALRIRPREYPAQIMILNCAPSASEYTPMHEYRRTIIGWTDSVIDQGSVHSSQRLKSLIVAPPNPKTQPPALDLRSSNLRMDGLQPVGHERIVVPIETSILTHQGFIPCSEQGYGASRPRAVFSRSSSPVDAGHLIGGLDVRESLAMLSWRAEHGLSPSVLLGAYEGAQYSVGAGRPCVSARRRLQLWTAPINDNAV
ncbi:hypothetical protein BDN71DRAFT_1199701 [Pleurotus eryngii]|uniref:Uncharacterized protein n=1 Tax=Pleurotus eryngii TaxID=5323 RepID=A0A9P6DD81_PLEER|nr:hypothetical protein BDN71DRAFT_1199701 [Pleurotus eryngii]